jgi:hypothetical protein
MLKYTAAELLQLRPGAPAINRSTRKTLFALQLWQPSRFRFRVDRLLPAAAAAADPALDSGLHPVCPKRLGCRSVTAACLNTHSARNKSASLQEIIASNDIDVFAVTETWHSCSDDVALRRIIPPGYRCLEAARPARPQTKPNAEPSTSAGGVALFHLTI